MKWTNKCHWICLLGIFQPSNWQGLFFLVSWSFTWQPDNSPREHAHNTGHQGQSCPPNSNGLFPQQSELPGYLLSVYHHLGHASELIPGEEDHLLWGLPFSDLLPCDMSWQWGCLFGCYGLWPLCGYLPPSSIWVPHQCESLCLFNDLVLVVQAGEFWDTHSADSYNYSVWTQTRPTTCSVASHCSWGSPSQTLLSMSLCSMWPVPLLAWAPACLLQHLTYSSFLLSFRFPLLRARERSFLPVHHTSLQ